MNTPRPPRKRAGATVRKHPDAPNRPTRPRKRIPINRPEPPSPPAGPTPGSAVHVAVASPWQDLLRRNESDRIERVRWDLPDGVKDGDTVTTVVDAREWAITAVSVRWTPADSVPTLHRVHPHTDNGVAMAALDERLGEVLPRTATTLETSLAQRLLDAIEAELRPPDPLGPACEPMR